MARLRTAIALGLTTVGAALLLLAWDQKHGYVDRVATGAKAIEDGRFEDRNFERADGHPFASRDLLIYNRGVRAYAAGQLAEAARLFQEVISRGRSPSLRAKAYYNLGNLLALEGKPHEAVALYREALRLDPGDWDAKANLEMLSAELQSSEAQEADAPLTQAAPPEDHTAPGGPRGSPGGKEAGI